jgi:hypothetical protein
VAAAKPRTRADLAVYQFGEELVIYDPTGRQVHYLNPTGALVFRLCDGTATVRETVTDVAETYGLARREVEKEVRTVVRQLRHQGLLEHRRRPPKQDEQAAAQPSDQRRRVRMEVPRST